MANIEFSQRPIVSETQSCRSPGDFDSEEGFHREQHLGIQSIAFCILWSPLPVITWIFPFIGHMGVADSQGVVYDFQGPYSIGKRTSASMAFGPVTRVVCVDVSQIDTQLWDEAIYLANDVYSGRMHNLLNDNCHSHVANALNRINNINVLGFKEFNMVNLALIMFIRGRFLSFSGFIYQFAPFAMIVLLYCLLKH